MRFDYGDFEYSGIPAAERSAVMAERDEAGRGVAPEIADPDVAFGAVLTSGSTDSYDPFA
jgi:hypothetical protein